MLAFPLIMVAAIVVALPDRAHAGFLYVLNERNSTPNQIYGFNVNESTGALAPLAGFPISSGGNGSGLPFNERMVIDPTNFRLYVVNVSSGTVSAFSINVASGGLTHLPFSPLTVGGASVRTIAVHPFGSPLIAGNFSPSGVFSFNITATSATAASGSPYSTGGTQTSSSVFSRDANFLYAGGTNGRFAGYGVNQTTGVMTPLPGSPFASGVEQAVAYAADSRGRLFTTNDDDDHLRAFTTAAGVPTGVTGNPFASGLGLGADGEVHPNEKFYYVSDVAGDTVGAYRIAGTGSASSLSQVGSPVASGGTDPRPIVLNNAGTLLFAANSGSRNITTFNVDASTGALTVNNVQPVDALGTLGSLTGMDYLPTVFSVLSTGDSGPTSLRQAITSLNSTGGGIITFHPPVFNVPRTISLTSGQLLIDSNISIVGTGAKVLTVRNTGAQSFTSRVFSIAEGRHVSINGISITGGNPAGAGGGITSFGILTIRDCVVSGNTTNNVGGGIRNGEDGVLNIINSTIAGNRSNANSIGVGGVYSAGTLIVTNSTISGNTTVGGSASVGGIYSLGTTTITNSTTTNNSAPLGVGGIVSSASLRISNSIVAGNGDPATSPDVLGGFVSGGFNLIGNRGGVTAFNQTGDQAGTTPAPLDPKLVKVLAYKGGPTPVHVPLPNSPAVDKGNNGNIVTDQRGLDRPFDDPGIPNTSDGADIGAFERRSTESLFTAPFDFDGDGKTDIGIFRPSVAEWWINQSSTGVTTAAQFGAPTDWIMPSDLTGDGKTDIAFWRPLSGEWFVLRSEDFSYFSFPFGTRGDLPTVGDFDGDAIADAAVYRPSAVTWFIRRSSDGGATIQQFGASGDAPVPADYDGDGRADIAIYRPSLGQWWLLRSTAGVIALTFGNANDQPVPGDYTGDGKSDVAFWRPSTGEWFVLRSEDFSFFSFPFGSSGDTPAPGDYDGDGKFDATVFRPSQATWFSQRTTGGTLIVRFGLSGDRPIPNAFVPVSN